MLSRIYLEKIGRPMCEMLEPRKLLSFAYGSFEEYDFASQVPGAVVDSDVVLSVSDDLTFQIFRVKLWDQGWVIRPYLFGPDGFTPVEEITGSEVGVYYDNPDAYRVTERGDFIVDFKAVWWNESETASNPTGRLETLEDMITRIDAPPEFGAIDLDRLSIVDLSEDGTVVLQEPLENNFRRIWALREGTLGYLWKGNYYDVDAEGTIAGRRLDPETGRFDGVLAKADGSIESLGTFFPTAIDPSGWMAGYDGKARAVAEFNGERYSLGFLVNPQDRRQKLPYDINARGDIAAGNMLYPVAGRVGGLATRGTFTGDRNDAVDRIELDADGNFLFDGASNGFSALIRRADLDLDLLFDIQDRPIFGENDPNTLVVLDQNGTPLRLIRDAAEGWIALPELGLMMGDAPAGPQLGSSTIIGTGIDSRLLFLDAAGDLWASNPLENLSQAARDAGENIPVLSGNIVTLRDRQGVDAVLARAANGDLYAFPVGEGSDSIAFGPSFETSLNLTKNRLQLYGQPTPVLVGDLEVLTTPWQTLHIVGLDAAGDVWSVWTAPSMKGRWVASNMSDIAGAPVFVGNIGAISTEWGAIHLFGTSTSGNTVALWWSPALGPGNWRFSDLTATAGGPAIEAGSIATLLTPWGSMAVFGISQSTGTLVATWWAPSLVDGWRSSTLVTLPGGALGQLTGPMAAVVAADGSQSVAAVTTTGFLIRAFWLLDSSGGWAYEDLTSLLGG